jgi:hypothetical protein
MMALFRAKIVSPAIGGKRNDVKKWPSSGPQKKKKNIYIYIYSFCYRRK